MKDTLYEKYCTGCGLCKAIGKAQLVPDEKGYLHPQDYDLNTLKQICPVSGNQVTAMNTNSIWGKYENVYIAWSQNSNVRKNGSSGGIITEIAEYLLAENKVDGIIQTKASAKPTETVTIISRTVSEVRECAGSRYSISSPLQILDCLKKNERYALVAKPCDIVAFENFSKHNQKFKKQILYTISFFCAGLPSKDAQKRLLEDLNCKDTSIVSLRYRGNGWPGFTTAIDKDNNEYQISYAESWGKILGRDIMPMCRYCIDGIGEAADISCGDAWYIGKDGYPDFAEHDGRNVVFCRTDTGHVLFKELIDKKRIHAEDYTDFSSELYKTQYAQRERRETMLAKKLAQMLLLKKTPQYSLVKLYEYAKGSNIRRSFQVFKGTIKRTLQKKM